MKRWGALIVLLLAGWLVLPASAQNYFWVVVNGIPIFPFTIVQGGAVNLGTTSTDGLVLNNSSPADASTTVQVSPRLKWCGSGWNSSGGASETDCWIIETLPATVAGTTTSSLLFKSSIAGAGYTTRATMASSGNFTSGASLLSPSTSVIGHSTRTTFISPADGLENITITGTNAFGLQLNIGTAAPTVTTCGSDGALATGSRNAAGAVTSTDATACTVTFGAPAWTNTPFCVFVLNNIFTTTRPYVSATSTTAFTVSSLTAGDDFTYLCLGRI